MPVLTPLALNEAYTYLAPQGELSPGDFVVVPLGPMKRIGVVWREAAEKELIALGPVAAMAGGDEPFAIRAGTTPPLTRRRPTSLICEGFFFSGDFQSSA